MIRPLINFYRTGAARPPLDDPLTVNRLYARKRWSVFIGVTVGYAFFYVCKLGFSVTKKPILDAKLLSATELGLIGSALLFTYAFGKLINGFLADRSNIKRFMSTGLLASALINLAVGRSSAFWVLIVLWGVNGWFQSMGSAPSVVALSQWFSNRERGTRYGLWSVSHSLGEGLTFAVTASLVAAFGWRWGFTVAGLGGLFIGGLMLLALADRPVTYGLPTVAEFKNDFSAGKPKETSVGAAQWEAVRNWAVWVLGLSSACMYVSRYAMNNWAVLFLQEAKGYSLTAAGTVLAAYPMMGVVGSATSGWVSDRWFASRRNLPALLYGLLETTMLVLFYLIPPGHRWLDTGALALFGFALGGLLVYLGGLMAVDICSKRATGAAMGLIGLMSYLGAAIQDSVSGYLIESSKVVVNGQTLHSYHSAFVFWIGASVASLLLACLVWRVRPQE